MSRKEEGAESWDLFALVHDSFFIPKSHERIEVAAMLSDTPNCTGGVEQGAKAAMPHATPYVPAMPM